MSWEGTDGRTSGYILVNQVITATRATSCAAPTDPDVRNARIRFLRQSGCCPCAVPWPSVVRVGARKVSPLCPASGCSARRRLPSRGSLGPHFPTFPGTLRRYDCHPPPLGSLRLSLASRYLACFRLFVVSLTGSWPGRSAQTAPGLLVTRSPTPGLSSRRQVALPSSRVPPIQTCPALRPRWCPAH